MHCLKRIEAWRTISSCLPFLRSCDVILLTFTQLALLAQITLPPPQLSHYCYILVAALSRLTFDYLDTLFLLLWLWYSLERLVKTSSTIDHLYWIGLKSISKLELTRRVSDLVSAAYVRELSVGFGQTPLLIVLEELNVEVHMIEVLLLQFGNPRRIPLVPLPVFQFQTFVGHFILIRFLIEQPRNSLVFIYCAHCVRHTLLRSRSSLIHI